MKNTQLRITATLSGLVALAACSDLALEPAQQPGRFEITPDNALVHQEEPFKFSLKVYDKDGEEMPGPPSWAPAQWFPADPSAVFVHPDGTADLLRGGQVRILARLADLEATVQLRINPSEVRLSTAAIHLNQGAQNIAGTIPVIAGRPALLRVFAVGDQVSYYRPNVRATFFLNDEAVFTPLMNAAGELTPDAIVEAGLQLSYNAVVPARIVRPGLEVVVELDVDGDVPPAPGTQLRFPAEGRHAFDVREVATLTQVFVPTLVETRDYENSILEWTDGLTADDDKIAFMRKNLPVSDVNVIVREPYLLAGELTGDLTVYDPDWREWLRIMSVLQVVEGRRGYYYGVAAPYTGWAVGGLGWVGLPASVGGPWETTYAHELGHNMGLRHAPCGGVNPQSVDTSYPSSYDEGSIGRWGWDIQAEEQRDPGRYKDLMTYCGPEWVSDYHFGRALNFRLEDEEDRLNTAFCWRNDPPDWNKENEVRDYCDNLSAVLLWGSTGPDELYLEPTFVVETQPAVPSTGGPYRLAGFDDDGVPIFSFDFTPAVDAEGGSGFVFAVPYDPERDGALAQVVLSGPDGSYTLGRTTAAPMAMVTNRDTGLIRSLVRDWRGDLPSVMSGNFDIVVSEGLSWSGGR